MTEINIKDFRGSVGELVDKIAKDILQESLQEQAKKIFAELDSILTFDRVKVKDNYDKIKKKYKDEQ